MTLQAMFEQALGFHQQGRLAEAERLYRDILRTAARNFDARHMLGILRAQQGRNAEALDLIGEALKAKPDDPLARTNYGNVLAALGRFEEALTCHDLALAHSPAYPDALNNRGNALRGLGQFEGALQDYDAALALQPDHPDAQNNRGSVLQDLKRFEEAVESHDRALALQPGHVEAYVNRGNALLAMSRHAQALESYDRALALRPHHVAALNNRGQCLQAMMRLQDALECFDRAIAAAPEGPEARLSKGLCLLLMGKFDDGLPLYEWRKKLPAPVEARNYDAPLWTGAQDINAKTLFLYIEQGLGDTLQFYRYVALAVARGANVILSAQDALLCLLRDAGDRIELAGYGVQPDHFDFHCPLMSLPLALRTTADAIPADVPYLSAQPDRIAHWAGRIGAHGLRIGISWEGNRHAVGGAGRAFPLRALENIARLPGVRLISLQKGAATQALRELPHDMVVETLGEDFDSGPDAFLDSAAAMESLDLVITMDATMAHLAGALARPVWVALKFVPDWRWLLDRTDSPWYPTATLFRQRRDGDWTGVFSSMERQLAEQLR